MSPAIPERDPLPFSELLAALQRDRCSCTVRVTDGLFDGELRLEDGELDGARFAGLAGRAAVDAMLIAEDVRASVVDERELFVTAESTQPAESTPPVAESTQPFAESTQPFAESTPPGESTAPSGELPPKVAESTSQASVSLDEARADASYPRIQNATLVGMGAPPPLPQASPPMLAVPIRAFVPEQPAIIPPPPDEPDHAHLRSWAQRVSDERARHAHWAGVPKAPAYGDEDDEDDDDQEDTEPRAVASQSSIFPARLSRDRTKWIAGLLCAPILIAFLVRSFSGDHSAPLAKSVTVQATAPVHVPKVVGPQLSGTVAPVVSTGGLAPTVMLRVLVGADGAVKQASVQSPRPGLGQLEKQAADTVRGYQFKPATADGKPVEHWISVPVPFRSAPLAREVDVKGSDTIGATLGPAWARGLERKLPGVTVKLESLGSSTGIAGLLDGSAAVAMSSRPIRPDELAFGERLGVQLREVVVGFDGVAAIVHPQNPVHELTVDSFARVFAQRTTNWSQLSGTEGPIHVLGRPSYSGTHTYLRERMLAVLGPGGGFGPTVETIEAAKDIVARVANDVNAIGYIGIGQLDPSVRALAIAPRTDAPAVIAREETIRDGSYPIARPLYLYVRADADQAARAWVDYALSAEGQAAVSNSGFVPVQAGSVSPLADETPAQHVAAPAITRLYFAPNSASIEPGSRALLLAAAAASHAGKRALVVGHADSVGKVETNERLARQRAEAIARLLRQHGWSADALEIEVAASTHPLASNTTADGRKANRRVDLMLLNR